MVAKQGEEFGQLMRKLRKERGATLDAVARAIGKSISYLSDVEVGRRNPLQTDEIVKFASVIGVDPVPLINAAARSGRAMRLRSNRSDVHTLYAGLARHGDELPPEVVAQMLEMLERTKGRGG